MIHISRCPFRLLLTALSLAFALQASDAFAQFTGKQLLVGIVEKYDPANYPEIEAAVAAYQRGDLSLARTTLVSARKKHSELPPAEALLALLHLATNRRADAEAALDQAAQSDPADPESYLLVAELSLREGRPLSASIAFDYARQMIDAYTANPYRRRMMDVRLHAGQASLSETRGDPKAAVEHLQAWLEDDPKNPIALGSLGRVHFIAKDYEKARAAFVKLEETDKDAPPADVAMGRLYSDKELPEEALSSMKAAVAARPDDVRTLLTVADWAFTAGRIDMAHEHVEAALAKKTGSFGADVLKARLARNAGDLASAERLLKDAVLRAPADFVASNELARTLALSDDESKRKLGLEYATRNYRLVTNRATPIGREATVTLAWLLVCNDRSEEGERILLTLPDGSTVSSENAYLAARIYAALNRRDSATSALRAALSNKVHFVGRADAEKLLAELSTGG